TGERLPIELERRKVLHPFRELEARSELDPDVAREREGTEQPDRGARQARREEGADGSEDEGERHQQQRSLDEPPAIELYRLVVGFDADGDATHRGDDQRSNGKHDRALDDDTNPGDWIAENELQAPIRIFRAPARDLGDRETGHQQLRETEPD